MDYQATPDDDRIQGNEEGEFELVLGNKQLLSVFFVAVLLLGVFFIMGYIVGRNLSPEPPLVAEGKTGVIDLGPGVGTVTQTETAPAPKPAEPAKPVAMPKQEEPAPKPVEQAGVKPAPAPPPTKPVETKTGETKQPKPAETKQAETKQPPKPAETKQAPTKQAEAKQPPKPAETKPTPAPKPVEPGKPAPAKPAPTEAAKPAAGGYYLQVAAASPAKVSGIIASLKGKGFATTTQPVPGSELVRILVGPYDANAATDGAAKLKAAGFDSIRKKL